MRTGWEDGTDDFKERKFLVPEGFYPRSSKPEVFIANCCAHWDFHARESVCVEVRAKKQNKNVCVGVCVCTLHKRVR